MSYNKTEQPPAEGAEAILHRYIDKQSMDELSVNVWPDMLEAMHEFAAQQQPTAEGAEEIEAELRGYARDIVRLHKPIMEVNPQLAMDSIGNDLVKMFNRLAQRIADKMVSERDDLQKLMNDISEWSGKTFGDSQRNPAIVYHLKKEVDELIAAIEKTNTLGGDPSVGVGEFGRQRTVTRVEYADCLMLLLDSAHHFGISAKELLSVTRGKLEINKVRKWGKPDENGVVEHIE